MILSVLGGLDATFACAGGEPLAPATLLPGHPVPERVVGGVGAEREHRGRYRFLRDPLGINKLFWGTSPEGPMVASRPVRLVGAGCEFSSIRAVPPGMCVDMDATTGRAEAVALQPDLFDGGSAGPATLDELATAIRRSLETFGNTWADRYRGVPAFVCLSGGLDSTAVAATLREVWTDVTAVSFDLIRAHRRPSEDRQVACRVARDLGLQFAAVDVRPDDLLGLLDVVLTEGVDWRDFNVHAGLVSAALARGIDALVPSSGERRALVFSGDLLNEFLVDYHEEYVEGSTYYRLPGLDVGRRRRVLVRGLETSHREVGIFAAWCLPIIPLFAGAAYDLVRIPEVFLKSPEAKSRLLRAMFQDRIPAYVYDRPKTRAQIGGPDGAQGVLGLCHRNGLDTRYLRRRFAQLHKIPDDTLCEGFIRAGRYRSAVPALA